MGNKPTTASSSQEVIWMWKSNTNPWDDTEPPSWMRYSDVENMIIEKAYQTKETHAMLDGYRVVFSEMKQISNNDNSKQRPVKRTVKNSDNNHLSYEKVTPISAPVKASVANRPGVFGDFIWEAYLLGRWRDVSQEILMERAAQEIIEESKKIDRVKEGKDIAEYLLEKKNSTRIEIWRRCVYLYSLESFLYKRLNETLRLVNSQEHEQEWKSRLETLGLFAWFLFDFPQDAEEFEGYLYRGVTMDDDTIDTYKIAAETSELLAFPTFTSTSRNRSKGESFGNTLVIISMVRSRETSVDSSILSEYPDEEEQLLIAGFLYKVTRVELDDVTKKHLIYLQDCNNQ